MSGFLAKIHSKFFGVTKTKSRSKKSKHSHKKTRKQQRGGALRAGTVVQNLPQRF